LALPLSPRVLIRFHLIGDRVDHVTVLGVDGLGRPDNVNLGHARRARVHVLAGFQAQHRPFLGLVADVQKHARERQCLLTVDLDAEANAAPADDARESHIYHALQKAAPTSPGSFVCPRLLELPHDGDVGDSDPPNRSRDIVDETDANGVQFVR